MRLHSVQHEHDRWSVQIQINPEIHGLSAGTWMSNSPSAWGLTINAPDTDALREIAALLVEAADDIDDPPTPAEMDRADFESRLP